MFVTLAPSSIHFNTPLLSLVDHRQAFHVTQSVYGAHAFFFHP